MAVTERSRRRLGIKDLDRVLDEMLLVMENSQDEIISIADRARSDYESAARELAQLKAETSRWVSEVDGLERSEREARQHLLEVSVNLSHCTEAEIRRAYESARDAQVKLLMAREREKNLRRQRDSLEIRLRFLKDTCDMANKVLSQTQLAADILRGELLEISREIGNIEQRQELAFSILKAQEEERRRVARDIHDGPAQLLANIIFRLQVCERLLDTDIVMARRELCQLKDSVRESLQDVRRIVFDLRPIALDDLGLVPGLGGYLTEFEEKTGLKSKLSISGLSRRLDPAVETALFRIIQEALNNVHKHAGTSQAFVRLHISPDTVVAVVEDKGRGFSADKKGGPRLNGGFGLMGIRERVALLNGDLEVVSSPGSGTRIKVQIPLNNRLQNEESQSRRHFPFPLPGVKHE